MAVAPSVGTLLGGPALGMIVSTALTAVLAAENPGAEGKHKKEEALRYMAVVSPAVIQNIEYTTGKELVNVELYQQALSRMIDASVDLMNAFEMLPRKEKA